MERITQVKKFVLDTSVVVKWFSGDEDDAEHANKLRHQIQEGLCVITIPDLLFYELANALRHNPNFTAEDVRVALDSVFDMEFDIRKVDIHSVLYNCACFIKNIVAIAPCIKNFFYRVSQFLQS